MVKGRKRMLPRKHVGTGRWEMQRLSETWSGGPEDRWEQVDGSLSCSPLPVTHSSENQFSKPFC